MKAQARAVRDGLDTPARRRLDPGHPAFLSRPASPSAGAEPVRTFASGADVASGAATSRIPSHAAASSPLGGPDQRGLERLIRATLQRTLSANPVSGRTADLRAVPMAIGRPIPTP